MNNLKKILYQAKKFIDVDKYEHLTGTLATTFYKPVGEENPYFRLEYYWQKSSKHTRGKVSRSMNAYQINTNK